MATPKLSLRGDGIIRNNALLSLSLILFTIAAPGPSAVPASRPEAGRQALLLTSDFENGRAEGWRPNTPDHWQIVDLDGSRAYALTAPGEQGKVRAPTSWSVAEKHDLTSFVFTGRLKSDVDTANARRDLCVIFHFQDPTHFIYVHFSASSDDAHNIIGLVNGADRVKINLEPPGKSVFRLTDKSWHAFKVTCDPATGRIAAYLDDMNEPMLTAVDRTLSHGLVGVGSFDDTGFFDDLKLVGEIER
jgi:hypothetical protein